MFSASAAEPKYATPLGALCEWLLEHPRKHVGLLPWERGTLEAEWRTLTPPEALYLGLRQLRAWLPYADKAAQRIDAIRRARKALTAVVAGQEEARRPPSAATAALLADHRARGQVTVHDAAQAAFRKLDTLERLEQGRKGEAFDEPGRGRARNAWFIDGTTFLRSHGVGHAAAARLFERLRPHLNGLDWPDTNDWSQAVNNAPKQFRRLARK